MKVEINIPDFKEGKGIALKWENEFSIEVKRQSDESILIKANEAGLISLANHLLSLSSSLVPTGYHLHFDDLNSLEDNSNELIIEKKC